MIINYKNIFSKNKVFIKYMSINYTNIILIIFFSIFTVFSIRNSFKRQSKIEKYIKNLKQENYI
jgi:preprotein translocase subunit YajC